MVISSFPYSIKADKEVFFEATHKSNLGVEHLDGNTYYAKNVNSDFYVVVFGGIKDKNTQAVISELENLKKSYSISIGEILTVEADKKSIDAYYKKHPDLYIDIAFEGNKSLMQTIHGRYDEGTSVNLPVVLIINKSDDLLYYNSGSKVKDCLKKALDKLIDRQNKLSNTSKYIIEGEINYDYAYDILNRLNDYRTQNGLNALVMDESLLEGAMQRAAELTFVLFITTNNLLNFSIA